MTPHQARHHIHPTASTPLRLPSLPHPLARLRARVRAWWVGLPEWERGCWRDTGRFLAAGAVVLGGMYVLLTWGW